MEVDRAQLRKTRSAEYMGLVAPTIIIGNNLLFIAVEITSRWFSIFKKMFPPQPHQSLPLHHHTLNTTYGESAILYHHISIFKMLTVQHEYKPGLRWNSIWTKKKNYQIPIHFIFRTPSPQNGIRFPATNRSRYLKKSQQTGRSLDVQTYTGDNLKQE